MRNMFDNVGSAMYERTTVVPQCYKDIALIQMLYLQCTTVHCAVHTVYYSSLCSTYSVLQFTVQYTQCTTVHCTVHTVYYSSLYSTYSATCGNTHTWIRHVVGQRVKLPTALKLKS